jgi:hypothetical protein
VYSTGDLRASGSRPSLGRPFPNERIYILDGELQPVPVGVTGEIYIGGDKLARGYLNRPELTAEKFLKDPFASETSGARMYRTGDLGRWRADGTIESLGRADFQVKIRGFRVELGEVQAALAKLPGVRECVVLARPDSSGNNRLLAWVVGDRNAAETRAWREQLQRQLPEYMVPSAIMVLETLPLTANGKLDRRALPDPEADAEASSYVAPRNTTEELMAEIWRDVLALKQVGMNDNFFEVGGHSLLATQVISRVRETLNVDLSMRQFFVTPTIAGLAPIVEQALIADIKATDEPEADGVLVAAKE